MNGWGHFAAPVFWFNLYWTLARGRAPVPGLRGLGARCTSPVGGALGARSRARLRGGVRVAVVLLLLALRRDRRVHLLQHERPERVRAFGRGGSGDRRSTRRSIAEYRDLPQPRIVAVRADVDIFPPRAPCGHPRHLPAGQPVERRPIAALHVGVLPGSRIQTPGSAAPSGGARRPAPRLRDLRARRRRSPRARRSRFGFEPRDLEPGLRQQRPRQRGRRERDLLPQPPVSRRSAIRTTASWRDPSERRGRGCPRPSRMAKIDDLAGPPAKRPRAPTPTGSISRPRSARTPTRSRSRPAPCSASGPRADGATSTTRWTRRSRSSSPFSPPATRCGATPGRASTSRSSTTPATSTTSTGWSTRSRRPSRT